MEMYALDPGLALIQNADLDGKVVLVRFDHNVVKDGEIKDPYRIDSTLGTLYNIVERGGRPILMTHIGRPGDKKTGEIKCRPGESVEPIVGYLEHKLHAKFRIPKFHIDPKLGITGIDTSINLAIKELRERKTGGIYLPNTRWFQGEEAEGEARESFALQLAGLADIYINDAFGSWQAHASTYDVTKYLPSYAGFLMQKEIANLGYVLNPERPFLAVIAGAKYDTKIKPLYAIYDKVDKLILGGVIYNAFLCAKYGVSIEGVSDKDVDLAQELVEKDKAGRKIVELPCLVESDTMEGKFEGKYRTVCIRDFKEGNRYKYMLDIDPSSFVDRLVAENILGARTIFVNAVMGFTPYFAAGSAALDSEIDHNRVALKMYGGGDTLQEFKDLCPGLYLSVLDNTQYYFFTGGGAVLTAIEQGSPYGLKPVQALLRKDKTEGPAPRQLETIDDKLQTRI
ncbi:MAG: phosphoglycerate kinase [Nitrospirae bacterium]|nr:phosphoglycerate kinase [Nitrospirota bacterium]MCL5238080.1 phosphoglycerate kinase [Nitrospirota bacterium]